MKFSLRSLLVRRGAKLPAAHGKRANAETPGTHGNAAKASEVAAKSIEDCRSAVDVYGSSAPAHLNLGIALQAAGELPSAMESFERAIALDPGYVAAHYNLALVHLLVSRFAEAEAGFRSALRLRSDFPEAWVGLADALESRGRNEDAVSALGEAIHLRTDYVGAQLNLGALLCRMGRQEAAAAIYGRVVELQPESYEAHCGLGVCLQELGRLAEAEIRFREALALMPGRADARTNLALLLLARGRTPEAIPLLFQAVATEPSSTRLRRTLAEALRGVALSGSGVTEQDILLSLCMDDRISMQFLHVAVASLMKCDQGFRILQERATRGEDPFTSIDPAVDAFLRAPLVLAALPRMQFPDAAVEIVLTHLRRCILMRYRELPDLAASDPVVPAEFVCAFARQCFFTGYAYFASADELQRVASLRTELETSLSEAMPDPRSLETGLAVASLYASLYTLQDRGRLLKHPLAGWSEAFRPIVTEQIENRSLERELALRLPSLTAIHDEVSLAVRAQYEENPYPRWVTGPSPNVDTIEDLARRLRPDHPVRARPRPVQILVAGCGTGLHPVQVSWAFPDAEILAVDLSLASLGYAARMTAQLGIANIDYRQADILALGSLDRRFAIVECCGVLHHLDDPMAGWRILVDLMEPDGLMKVALYSAKARSSVRAAREFSRSRNFPLTSEGTRQCRNAIMRLPDGHPAKDIMHSPDFFTLDGCRDLMMHVQEHQFTLPSIADCLERLGLQLLKLECSAATRNRVLEMFPAGDAETSFVAWDRFEDAYPETFSGMYSFWCCRN